MDRLQGKIAVITGAAKGIGYETANRFVDEGAQVIMSDLNVELGEAASRNLGNACSFFKQDVTDESSWDELEDYIETNYGGIDILVNNAGILATETTQNIETTSLGAMASRSTGKCGRRIYGMSYGRKNNERRWRIDRKYFFNRWHRWVTDAGRLWCLKRSCSTTY